MDFKDLWISRRDTLPYPETILMEDVDCKAVRHFSCSASRTKTFELYESYNLFYTTD